MSDGHFCWSILILLALAARGRGLDTPALSATSIIASSTPGTAPTFQSTAIPPVKPLFALSAADTGNPTQQPSCIPSYARASTVPPSYRPSLSTTISPSRSPSLKPSTKPTFAPTFPPTSATFSNPTAAPTVAPSMPTPIPTSPPYSAPSYKPSDMPSIPPSATPSTAIPTGSPTYASASVTISATQKFSITKMPSGFLANATNYNSFARVIKTVLISSFGKNGDVIINSLSDTTSSKTASSVNSIIRYMSQPSLITARYTITVTNGLSYTDLSAKAADPSLLLSFSSSMSKIFPTITVTASGAPTGVVDITPTTAPTSSPTSIVINYSYFALLSLLAVPFLAAIVVYYNYNYCCKKDCTPSFHFKKNGIK